MQEQQVNPAHCIIKAFRCLTDEVLPAVWLTAGHTLTSVPDRVVLAHSAATVSPQIELLGLRSYLPVCQFIHKDKTDHFS